MRAHERYFRRNRILKKALARELDFYFQRTTLLIDADIGRRIVNARKVMKLTQAELGQKLGLSQTDVHRMEHGMMRVVELSVAQFKAAFADHFDYVFRGSKKFLYEETKVSDYINIVSKVKKGKQT